jgi:hypothetical protein
LKKKELEDKNREAYRKRQADLQKLQMENLQAMYPEYYANPAPDHQSDNEAANDDN